MNDFLAEYHGHTRAAYRTDLTDYLRWCADRGTDPLRAQRRDLAGYRGHLLDAGRAPATVARRLSTLRTFHRYLVDQEVLATSPAQYLRSPRIPASRAPALGPRQLRALTLAADDAHPSVAALVWLLASTGVRVSAACAARTRDLTEGTYSWQLRVAGKGNVVQWLPVTAEVHLRLTRAHHPAADGPLLPWRAGTAMDRRDAYRAVARLAQVAGLQVPVTPHTLRRTFVTLARSAGCPLEDVQDAVGHADARTTRRYDRHQLADDQHPTFVLDRLLHALADSAAPLAVPALPVGRPAGRPVRPGDHPPPSRRRLAAPRAGRPAPHPHSWGADNDLNPPNQPPGRPVHPAVRPSDGRPR
ncbi:MAG: tyrosine-type recombinase/integrase [Sporichthyaceae bacterium]